MDPIGLFGILTCFVLLAGFCWCLNAKPHIRLLLRKLSLSAATFILLLLILEITFALLPAQSDDLNATLSSRKFQALYGGPHNSIGYRDVEHASSEYATRQVLFVVGDSFVEGAGIKDYRDRFSDVLQRQLGQQWLVANVGRGGWDTNAERNAVQTHPHKPHVIVLSYYVNDIYGAGESTGLAPTRSDVIGIPTLLSPFVNHSYFLNYAYWKVYRYTHGKRIGNKYFDFIQTAQSNTDIWAKHQADIKEFIDYTKQNQIQLVALVWPDLINVEASSAFTSKVISVFQECNVPTLDLAQHLRGRPASELIVSNYDTHPNVKTHHEVAGILFRFLNDQQILAKVSPAPSRIAERAAQTLAK